MIRVPILLAALVGCAAPPPLAATGGAPSGTTPSATTDPTGRVYLLDVPASSAVGDLFAALPEVLLGVVAVGESAIDLRLAVGDELGLQDLCVPTTELSGAWAEPLFDGAAPAWALELAGFELVLGDVSISGELAAEGVTGGSLAATVDGVEVAVEDLELPWLDGLAPLVARSEADVAADPACR